MKKFAVKIIGFFVKDHMAKYVVVTTAFVALFALLLYLAAVDVVSNVFGTIVGFILSSMLSLTTNVSITCLLGGNSSSIEISKSTFY